jgi:hypothetical protein
MSFGLIASTCARATRLRWPPLEPCLRLDERLAALHAIEGQAKRDIVARCLPRQQRVVLEQDADLRGRNVRLDGARKRLLQPDHGTQ